MTDNALTSGWIRVLNKPACRHALAAAAGLLLALAFPNHSIAGLAWIAPGLMLLAACGQRGAEPFRVGYVSGLVFWLASLRWLLNIPVTGFPILGWLLLSAYLAIFQGLWAWACWRLAPGNRTGPESPALADCSRWERLRWALLCAGLWVALEMIRARFLSGFPWSLLGASQFQLTPLLQISAFTGVYGVSFLVVWLSVSLLCATILLLQVNARRNTLVAEVFLPMLVIAIIFAAGYHHVTNVPPGERSIRVTAIQPSIPQTTIWNPSANQQRFADLMALSEQAVSNRTELLLWPEAALPELNETTYTVITNFAAQRQLWFLLGADDVRLRPGATREDDLLYFNAAWLLSPRGLIADTYHKRRLVMFGEYIPLADTLPFLKWFTTITGSFTPGKAATQLQLRDLDLIASPLICFEDVFPHGVREHVSESTDLLVNLTNDGWFGEGSAQWQHVANAVFRAIENRRPLVRACNNGVTCWIDAEGRVREVLLDGRDQPYGTGFVTFQIPIANRPHAQTFYNQHGDVFGWGCFILSGFAVAARAFRRKVAA